MAWYQQQSDARACLFSVLAGSCRIGLQGNLICIKAYSGLSYQNIPEIQIKEVC
jgi:hypothetical protein